MRTPGRKSVAALSVVTSLPSQRPAPPKELSADEGAEWRAIVARMPGDWFTRENEALLVAYCRHIVRARVIGQEINDFNPAGLADGEGLQRYDKLLKIAEREGRAMSSLAGRMRLTQQSRYKAEKAATAADKAGNGQKPWQFVK